MRLIYAFKKVIIVRCILVNSLVNQECNYKFNLKNIMLTTIAIILLFLWLLGVIGLYSIGWFVHILLVIAIVMFLIRVIRGENPFK